MADIDYDSLAEQARKPASADIDYDAIAKQARAPQSNLSKALNVPRDIFEGVGSGVVSTGVGAYNLARKIPGADKILPPVNPTIQAATQPPTHSGMEWPGQLGKGAEQVAEFMAPGGAINRGAKAIEGVTAGVRGAPVLNALGRGVLEGASAAGVTGVQTGGDVEQMKNAGLTAGAVGAAIPAVGAAVSAATPSASRIYQSALKPPLGGQLGKKAPRIVETGIREGIPTSEAGFSTAGNRIDQINQQIEHGIQARAQAGMTVNLQSVLKRLDDLKARAQFAADPKSELDAIKAVEDGFLSGHGTFDPATGALLSSDIPLDKAQRIKQVVGTNLRKSYGEMKSNEIEAKKQLVRGLKEEIESVFPEVAGLNRREGSLIDLEESLRRFVNREGNHQLISPFTLLLGSSLAGGGAASGHPAEGAFVGAMGVLLRMAMENPEIKSKIAIAARRASQSGIPGAMASGATNLAPKAGAAFTVNRDQPTPQFKKGGVVAPPNMQRSKSLPKIPNMERTK